MTTLYSASGAKDFDVGKLLHTPEQWAKIRALALRTLERHGYTDSYEFLSKLPFKLFEWMNGFVDDFVVLQAAVDLDKHLELTEVLNTSGPYAFSAIANAVSQSSGLYIRFVSTVIDENPGTEPVAEPEIESPSIAVAHALADARELIRMRGAVSAVDRVHTALHGYLRSVCSDADILVLQDPDITTLFKLLRKQHPKFEIVGPESDHVKRMLLALATVVDAANPLRNRATLVHANEALLREPEAMLVINSIRTLFNYVQDKLGAA